MRSKLAIRITLPTLHDTLTAVPAAVRRNKAVDSFLLASAILKHYFSLEWLEANLNDRGFLQMIETDQDSL
jgi:hypothetical protein